jgi:hypothetical protein
MTTEDKNAQIGAAVLEYQTAKAELGHLDQRIDHVFTVYREVGKTMDRHSHSPVEYPTIADGKLKLGWFYSNTKMDLSTDLLNEKELISLVQERDEAHARLERAKAAMDRLGVSNIR